MLRFIAVEKDVLIAIEAMLLDELVDVEVVTMSSDAWWLYSSAAIHVVDGTDVRDVRSRCGHSSHRRS